MVGEALPQRFLNIIYTQRCLPFVRANVAARRIKEARGSDERH